MMFGELVGLRYIRALLEGSGDRLEQIGILAVLGLLKAWNAYTDRRAKRSAGRRATDSDHAKCLRAIARLESTIGELASTVARQTSRLRALERKVDRAE